MIVRLPSSERWTKEFQIQLNGLLEQAFGQVNAYALVPSGGTTGQVLSKTSARDFELSWIDNASVGGDIAALAARLTSVENLTLTLSSDIGVERTNRVAADALLTSQIASANSQISSVSSSLGSAISNETAARIAGDNAVATAAAIASNLTSGTVAIARLPANVVRNAYGSANITVSSAAPSGGADGDIWLRIP